METRGWEVAMERSGSRGRRRIRPACLLIVIALVAAGCGDDGGTESFSDPITLPTTGASSVETDLINDFVATLESMARVPQPEARLRCIAEAAVTAVGAEELIAAGAPARGTFDGTLLDAAGQQALLEGLKACVDIGSVLTDANLVGVEIAPESVSCLTDEIEQNNGFETLARAIVAGGPEQAIIANIGPITETLASCLSLQEVAALMDAFGLVPFLPGG
jgi:hypothetical protein